MQLVSHSVEMSPFVHKWSWCCSILQASLSRWTSKLHVFFLANYACPWNILASRFLKSKKKQCTMPSRLASMCLFTTALPHCCDYSL